VSDFGFYQHLLDLIQTTLDHGLLGHDTVVMW